MGEVKYLNEHRNPSPGIKDRAVDALDVIAAASLAAPVLLAEGGATVTRVGRKVINRLIQPPEPAIPWSTPFDVRKELEEIGLSEEEIGRHQRFKRKVPAPLEHLAKIGD